MSETMAPATSAPAAPSTPSAPAAGGMAAPTSSPMAGVKSPGDIFAELERQMGLSDDQMMENRLGDAKKYRDGTPEDLEGLGVEGQEEEEVPTQEEVSTDETTDVEQTETEQTEPAFPKLKYAGKIGDKEYNFEIKDQNHLDKIVARAIHAENLYRENKEFKGKMSEYEELKEYKERFDSLAAESPTQLLDLIAEDMDEEGLKEWILATAQHLSQPKEQREIARKLKHAELLEQKMEEIRQSQEQLEIRRRQAMEEADKRAVENWHQGWVTKITSKIPEQYLELVQDRLYDARREAKERQAAGETVTLKTLDKIFSRKMKPVIGLINGGAISNKVNQKVGQAIQQKKDQNVEKVRAAAASQFRSGTQKPQTRMQKHAQDNNVFGMFDEILSSIDRGSIRIRGEE